MNAPDFAMSREAHEREKCRQLWCAVIHRGILDAQGETGLGEGTDEHKRTVLAAKSWLGTKDFRMCCDYAGLDHAAVMDRLPVGAR